MSVKALDVRRDPRFALHSVQHSCADCAQVAAEASTSGGQPVDQGAQLTRVRHRVDFKVPWHGINIDHTLRSTLLDATASRSVDTPRPARSSSTGGPDHAGPA